MLDFWTQNKLSSIILEHSQECTCRISKPWKIKDNGFYCYYHFNCLDCGKEFCRAGSSRNPVQSKYL